MDGAPSEEGEHRRPREMEELKGSMKEISRQVMAIFREYTDLVEPLSLDEAFLDVSPCRRHQGSATLIAREICRRIYHETGLTASAGVSCNKFLAKVASGYEKPRGLTVVLPDQAQDFLDALPIGTFYGSARSPRRDAAASASIAVMIWRLLSREELIRHFGKAGAFFTISSVAAIFARLCRHGSASRSAARSPSIATPPI